MPPRLPVLAFLAATLALLAPEAAPAEGVDPTHEYRPGEPPVTTTWFRLADPAARAADLRYIGGMRRHHEGALSMSEAYLRELEARSPALRRLAEAIIANQRYEIALLDEVSRRIEAAPRVLALGPLRLPLQPIATEGLGPSWRYFRAPIPGPADLAAGPPPTETDVRFAKAMSIHHRAALRMVRDYGADPAARNGFLGWLNVGIATDQSQEIALMRAVVRRFPGDPDAVAVDSSMIHGMEGHGGAHGAAAADPHADHHDHEQPAPPPPSRRERRRPEPRSDHYHHH
jgi:uncharacterized protein (DUF305 family)